MRDDRGFTLIELLIVIVLVGILAAIAIPRFSASQEQAYFAAIRSDLQSLASEQEVYYAANYTYATDMETLGFVSSESVTVEIGEATVSGWSASATHAALGVREGCAIYYGAATAPAAPAVASAPGEVACTN